MPRGRRHPIPTARLMESDFTEFRGLRVTVMGLGRFGGGLGAARFLADNGARVTVTDLQTEDRLSVSVSKLRGMNIRFVLGGHYFRDFTETDMVVVNPAVPMDSPFVKMARRYRRKLITEIGLFVERCPATVCGVTGSNGKSTTVSMLQSILESSGKRHWVGGNIGGSLLSDLSSIKPDDIVVLELSSFQLEWLRELKWSPHIAAVLNVMPNHLDRHGSFENYIEAKTAILDFQETIHRAVLIRDDPVTRSLSMRARAKIIWVGADLAIPGISLVDGVIERSRYREHKPIIEAGRLRVPGSHMVMNAMAASACAVAMKLDPEIIGRGLASFRGLPHRLEFVGESKGIRFYNDSKATTPEAAAAGVLAFDAPVIPILGGYDKKVQFRDMARSMKGRVKRAALIGDTAPLIADALEEENIEFNVFDSLIEAYKGAVRHAKSGDVVLLSPGCASYDMFANFEERGDTFKEFVNEFVHYV